MRGEKGRKGKKGGGWMARREGREVVAMQMGDREEKCWWWERG